jgi:uncharacterized membrane protein YphA (DoxX/SURF4 family)
MFEQAAKGEPRNVIGDWALRGFIAAIAIFAGLDKFPANTEWVEFFRKVGVGQWFRYFTGVVEVIGGLLVLIPRVAIAGLALLAVTMAAAAVISAFVRPSTCFIPAIFAICLGVAAWSRWR